MALRDRPRYAFLMHPKIEPASKSIGELIRDWRQRRRFSQLALAYDANVSPKHLSFIESGRAQPSREMVINLAERLDIPLRERNRLLLAAGFAPVFQERSIDHPGLTEVRRAVEFVLNQHEPYPALAIDRYWTLVSANRAVAPLLTGAAPDLLQEPINVLRLSLHPEGLAPRIVNLSQWRRHIFLRLSRQVEQSADPLLMTLLDELRSYPEGDNDHSPSLDEEFGKGVVIPLRMRTAQGILSFISTTMIFGTPLEVIASELAVESFFPADHATAAAFKALQQQ